MSRCPGTAKTNLNLAFSFTRREESFQKVKLKARLNYEINVQYVCAVNVCNVQRILFFYKIFYKNVEAEICENFKNMLRTYPG